MPHHPLFLSTETSLHILLQCFCELIWANVTANTCVPVDHLCRHRYIRVHHRHFRVHTGANVVTAQRRKPTWVETSLHIVSTDVAAAAMSTKCATRLRYARLGVEPLQKKRPISQCAAFVGASASQVLRTRRAPVPTLCPGHEGHPPHLPRSTLRGAALSATRDLTWCPHGHPAF